MEPSIAMYVYLTVAKQTVGRYPMVARLIFFRKGKKLLYEYHTKNRSTSVICSTNNWLPNVFVSKMVTLKSHLASIVVGAVLD